MSSGAHGSHTVAIVGGGAIGAALADALVDRLSVEPAARGRTSIVLFEKSPRVGRGLAYAKDDAPHLLNQSAQTMSLVPRRRSHFCDWLAARGALVNGQEDSFCTRELFGDYVEDCFSRTVEKARRRGIGLSVVHDEVTGLSPRLLGGHRVLTRGHGAVDASAVVLAIGNVRSRRFAALAGPSFFGSPYPSATLRRIPREARVAILGSGLTAIDAMLALAAGGHAAPVTMASRSGLLPSVRGKLESVDLQHVTRANVAEATERGKRPLRFRTVLRWLELELQRHGATVSWDHDFPAWVDPATHYADQIAAAERGPRVWQSVGEALNPMIEVLWHHLAAEDKALFLDRFYSRFMSHWVPIPLVTARRVLGLLRERRLRVERGLASISFDAELCVHRLDFGDRSEDFDVVIDATGAPRQLADCESPLLSALLSQGTIAAHEHGGMRVDFDSLRVIGRDGRVDPSLFAVGHLTCGTHLFTSTLEFNVAKADAVAAQIAHDLERRTEKDGHVDAPPHST